MGSPDDNHMKKPQLNMNKLSKQSSVEFSTEQSVEYSSKFRRMSHQVSYIPAGIKKIEKPIPLQELDKMRENEDFEAHFQTDSHGHIQQKNKTKIEDEVNTKQNDANNEID